MSTRLKDKNGKEIYEGDIIRRDDTFHVDGNALVSSIEFEDGHFFGRNKTVIENGVQYSGRCFLSKDEENVREIIGNIYENPELLETANRKP